MSDRTRNFGDCDRCYNGFTVGQYGVVIYEDGPEKICADCVAEERDAARVAAIEAAKKRRRRYRANRAKRKVSA